MFGFACSLGKVKQNWLIRLSKPVWLRTFL